MTITLGKNIASLAAQQRLGEATSKLASVYQQLSSGLRINNASDDAAGLAIADSLKSAARLSTTAVRNTNDGISMLNIASSALEAQQSIIGRLSELAEQSANGIYSDNQRTAINNEYQALVQEFDRIGASTTFNGLNLLSGPSTGGAGNVAIQVGISGASDSQLTLSSANTAKFSGTIGVTGDYDGTGTVDGTDFFLLNDAGATGFNSSNTIVGNQLFGFFSGSLATFNVKDSNGANQTVYAAIAGDGVTSDLSQGFISVYASDGSGGYSRVGLGSAGIQQQNSVALTFKNGATASISLDLRDAKFSLISGANVGANENVSADPAIAYAPGTTQASNIDFTGVETDLRARVALNVLQNRAAEISAIQGQYGALQARLGYALANNSVNSSIFSSAESQIRDADIAQDSSELIREQILQQSAASVLTHVNHDSNLILQLLQQ